MQIVAPKQRFTLAGPHTGVLHSAPDYAPSCQRAKEWNLLHPRARLPDLTASFGRTEVPKSLRTRETAEAKERFATEYAAIQRRWAALRAKPEPLPLKQIVSLAGRVYQRLTATLEDEPGESPIWENLGRLNKKVSGDESRLESW